MKSVSAGVRVAVLFLLLAIAGYLVWKNLGQNPAGKDNYTLFAKFRDASGLPKGTKVVIAGLPKGEVVGLEIEGRYAKVTFKLDTEIMVWTSAVIMKKARSLLGDNYLEIDPGEQVKQAPDGTRQTFTRLGPPCPTYGDADPRKSEACRQIVNVVEATTPDQLLHRIEQTLPNVDRVLESVRDLSEDVRRIVNGPLQSVATRVDGLVQREAPTVSDIIERADRSMARIEQITADLRSITKGADPRITRILANLDDASAEAKDLVATAKSELTQTGSAIRGKLDRLDGVINNTESITRKIDEDKGTLGRLVNDPELGTSIADFTDDARDAVAGLNRFKSWIGGRVELDAFSRDFRFYASAEIRARADKFYLVEFERGPLGGLPHDALSEVVNSADYTRTVQIQDQLRFTFQFGKQLGPIALRGGIKDSTFGVGADGVVLDGRLKLSADAYGSFTATPRLKLAGALAVFHSVYVLAGIDDALNRPGYLRVLSGNPGAPQVLDHLRYGRDYFVGTSLQFTDEDLAVLLRVYGAILVANLL